MGLNWGSTWFLPSEDPSQIFLRHEIEKDRERFLPSEEENKQCADLHIPPLNRVENAQYQTFAPIDICDVLHSAGSEWEHLIVVECSSYYHRS